MVRLENSVPRCCLTGSEFIRWFIECKHTVPGTPSFTGWGMLGDYLDCYIGEHEYVPVSFCPFCGKELE